MADDKKNRIMRLNKRIRQQLTLDFKKRKLDNRFLSPDYCLKIKDSKYYSSSQDLCPDTVHNNSPVSPRSQEEGLHHYILRHKFEESLEKKGIRTMAELRTNEKLDSSIRSSISDQTISTSFEKSRFNELLQEGSVETNYDVLKDELSDESTNDFVYCLNKRCKSMPILKLKNDENKIECLTIKNDKVRFKRKKIAFEIENSSRRNSLMTYIMQQVGFP